MMQLRLFFLLVLISASPVVKAQILPNLGGDRAGTSGFQFLKIPVDARSAALGETAVSNAFGASALYWNPALAVQSGNTQLGFEHTAYFADISLNYAALSFHPFSSNIAIGLSVQTLNSGEMDVTTEFEPFGTGERFNLTSLGAGLTLSQRLTNLFSYGITTKYVQENVAGITHKTMLFDLGIFYSIGQTGAQMAVAVRNFGLDSVPSGEISRGIVGNPGIVTESELESITPPTTFLLGVTYQILKENAYNDLLVSVQLNNPNDNAENWNMGLEYTWNDLLALRLGYRLGIEEYTTPSAGIGLHLPYLGPTLNFNYGFTRLERLGSVHRIGLNLGIN